jgi:hypothetical protein
MPSTVLTIIDTPTPTVLEVPIGVGVTGAVALGNAAPWNSAATYTPNEVAVDQQRLYLALAPSTNVAPHTDPTKWRLLDVETPEDAQTRIDAHISATVAHPAAHIAVASGTGLVASDVQAALVELNADILSQEAGDSAALAAEINARQALANLVQASALGGATAIAALLKAWTVAGMFDLDPAGDASYDSNAVILEADIVWQMDGSTGVWTTDTVNGDAGEPETWHVTHAASGKTVRQNGPITRDPATFAVLSKPALVVT